MSRRSHAARSGLTALALGAALLATRAAVAHERFVKHNLKHPLDRHYFLRDPAWLLGVQPDMLRIAINTAVVLALFLGAWFYRHTITQLLQTHVLSRCSGPVQRAVHLIVCFLTDRPVKNAGFHESREWATILFLRSPGLVLMYSATNDSLVMPSYPLDPASATFFKFAQVALAVLILTQTLYPLCGALIFGTWLYLFRWGWMVAIDALPVLTVAVVYVSSPWQSHKVAITSTNADQGRWARILLGLGFFALGWLKVYNHNLVAGVADNFPGVMEDPTVTLFSLGTSGRFARESWVIAFGLAEVLSGFLLMMGVFTRIWCAIMIFVFTKLMLVDFGWDEIPHIYPIGALAAVMFSNRLSSEFSPIEEHTERARRQGRLGARLAVVSASSLATAVIVIFPLIYCFTYVDRSNL